MIFLRHPTTDAGTDLCYGQLDVGLAPIAGAEIEAALAAIPAVAAIHASDLTRCRILADRFAERDGVTTRYDPRLREFDFGQWEGQHWSKIPRDQSDPWAADYWNNRVPGGENFADLHARVKAALLDIPPGALVVCHAGVIRAARMILTGAAAETVFAEKVPHCQPIRFDGIAA